MTMLPILLMLVKTAEPRSVQASDLSPVQSNTLAQLAQASTNMSLAARTTLLKLVGVESSAGTRLTPPIVPRTGKPETTSYGWLGVLDGTAKERGMATPTDPDARAARTDPVALSNMLQKRWEAAVASGHDPRTFVPTEHSAGTRAAREAAKGDPRRVAAAKAYMDRMATWSDIAATFIRQQVRGAQ